jgi:pimeloyl-ACP methyl ester carboxylesterase
MSVRSLIAAVALGALLAAPAGAAPPKTQEFADAVAQIAAEPYQPAYVPLGTDSAFPGVVPNMAPAQDYTSGSIPGNPDHPEWPAWFAPVRIGSGDGAPLLGRVALHPGSHPGVVVVHGFNTNGKESVIRWAAMLYANGYDVAAVDQRDFKAEYDAGLGYPSWRQTLGWKEAEDVLAAGRYLDAQPGVTSVGLVGFSLGGQDTVLALALDGASAAAHRVFNAGLDFSGPADQNAQVWSTAEPPGCATPFCTFPATQALALLVVPPYDTGNPCTILDRAAASYRTTAYDILAREVAFHAEPSVQVPLLNVYANDDPLVRPFHARMMAGYSAGNPLQRTLLVRAGNHAYFYDRWWQQRAILLYFKALLPGAGSDPTVTTTPTVNRTPGGAPFGSQLVDLGSPSRADADAIARAAPYVCDTTRPSPSTP